MAPVAVDGAVRGRGWCVTVYAGTMPDLIGAEEVFRQCSATYCVFGREVCPETSRNHLQGYLYFRNNKTKQGIIDLFWPYSPYIVRANGTLAKNREYCIKDGSFEEFGDIPVSPSERFHAARSLAQDGDVEQVEDELYLKYYSALHKMAEKALLDRVMEPLTVLQNIWISGPSGVGKSESWPQIFGRDNVFEKDPSKWWNRYKSQPIVVLSDWQPQDFVKNIAMIKNLADIRPVSAQVKGSYIQIRPRHVVVSSNFTLRECFAGLNADQYQIPVCRRFVEINLFKCSYPADCVCRSHCQSDQEPWLRTSRIIQSVCCDWPELQVQQEVAPVDGLQLLLESMDSQE